MGKRGDEIDVGRRLAWALLMAAQKVDEDEAKAGRAFVPPGSVVGFLDWILAGAFAARLTALEYRAVWKLRQAIAGLTESDCT